MEYILGFLALVVIMIAISSFMKKKYNSESKEAPKGEMGDNNGHGMDDGGDGDGGGN
jgi:hypothetical protein